MINWRFRRAVFLFPILCFLSFAGIAQQRLQQPLSLKFPVQLQSPAAWQSAHTNINAPFQVLVRFNALPTPAQKSYLAEMGLQLMEYIPSNGYTVVISLPSHVNLLTSIGATGIADISPRWKADEYLWQRAAELNTEKIGVMVSFRDGIKNGEICNKLQQIENTVKCNKLQTGNIYKFSITANKLEQLAAWHAVQYISIQSQDVPLNFESRTATRSNIASLSPVYGGFGLTGQGVIIGVGDNMSGITHIDLKERVINYNAQPYTNHGVHINGIVGGAGIMDPKGQGTAYRATLLDHYFSNVIDQAPAMVNAHNMTVTNNSYAATVGNCGYAGTYDVISQQVDRLALELPTLLNVFAAGNDGYLDCKPYPKGYATVNGAYQPAKNNIVVTSADKRLVNAIDGGRGPVKDGRLKPELTAVGVDVFSTTRKEEYLVSGGTSMACPAVAGALALLTERYRQINGNVNPPNDVLKALILNGANEIGNPGPDYRYGFGFMNLYRSIDMLNNNRYLQSSVSQGAAQTHTINVPANTAILKVMLVWNDVPASPMAASTLVNDLDLEVAEPSATVHYPLVLDATPANILNDAVEAIDRKNNTEQVTIYNPAAGSYTVTVKGYTVPSGTQSYSLAYDMVPNGISLGYPTAGAQVKALDSLRIYWDAATTNNPFTLEYSTNNGGSWTVINDNIPAEQRYYTWFTPFVNSGECKMRLTRNGTGENFTSGNFVINAQPLVMLDTAQCPGYISINWQPVVGATNYEVMRKLGPSMEVVATTSGTSYTFSALDPDSLYYVAVRPVLNGIPGYRSLGLKRQPNTGTCTGHISDGNLELSAILSPVSGRKLTSTELGTNETLKVRIRNIDDEACNYYRFSYSINGAPWQWMDANTPILPLKDIDIDVPGIDMSATGNYDIKLAITNLLMQDPVTNNDSAAIVVKHLKNDPVIITYTDDFEQLADFSVTHDSIGISPDEHWDFISDSDSGRLRSFINPSLVIGGNRSVSMDAIESVRYSSNHLIGTFNMTQYNAAQDEIRLEYDYIMHGTPDTIRDNGVWVRGSDTAKWQKVYTVKADFPSLGDVINSGSLSVSDALLRNGQVLTSSFQVRFGQKDTSLIGGRDYGCGMTLDNVKFYTVFNDVQLLSILSPTGTACGLTDATPIKVRIYNGVNQPQTNVAISYRIDGGNIVTEIIPNMLAKEQREYTFNTTANLSAAGKHFIDVWVENAGDTYLKNDTILNHYLYNQPLVTQYPYKEDFEGGEGGWFTDGVNNSWQYGTPASDPINHAYSGNKAWKTNLTGQYNSDEYSFLYSPCFDITGMANPTLRFRKAIEIENCGAMILCDAAYMEYSMDGVEWLKLGNREKGINWYNDTGYKIWTREWMTDWEETVIALPNMDTGILRMRFSFFSDISGNYDGIAVDDIEVFDKLLYPNTELISISPNPTTDGIISIAWSGNNTTTLQVVMRDVSGREVYRTTASAAQNYNRTTIQTPKFKAGVYFMNIDVSGRRYVYKIVYL